jgi:hypothetical protein
MNDDQPQQQQQSPFQQAVEREVRFVIGELTMQTIVLRQLLQQHEQAQQQAANTVQPMREAQKPNGRVHEVQ